jgi:hypothetical protein
MNREWLFNLRTASRVLMLVAVLSMLSPNPASAEYLASVETQITTSDDYYDTAPRLGADAYGEMIVVYTSRHILPSGQTGFGEIMAQRVDADGLPDGPVIQVSDGTTDDCLPDISGSNIVYTAYLSAGSPVGRIMVYNLDAGERLTVTEDAATVFEARIHDTAVVWLQGGMDELEVMYYDLDSAAYPIPIGGPDVWDPDIGDRYVVWTREDNNEAGDIMAYDRILGELITVSDDPELYEREPSSYGDFVVWHATTITGAHTIELADLSKEPDDPSARLTLIDDGSVVWDASIDDDLVAFRSDVAGNWDIYLHRISDGATFQVTTNQYDQFLSDLFGNMVVYADNRNLTRDVYLSSFSIVECMFDAHCDDGDDCTTDTCSSYSCENAPILEGDFCDGVPGLCCGGTCVIPECESHSDCADGDVCTGDFCYDPGTCSASCENIPKPDDEPCDGVPGICCAGTCATPACETDSDCDDGDVCTDESCFAPGHCSASCLYRPTLDGNPCADDGYDCTDDVCLTGLCEHPNLAAGTPCGDPADTDCDNPDSCDGSGVCLDNYESFGTPCPDGEFCTGDELCDTVSVCQPGTDPCPDSLCSETLNMCVECLTHADCGVCEQCDAIGACVPQAAGSDLKDECSDGVCVTGACDGFGACGFEADGIPCGDPTDNDCDNPDTCDGAGVCEDNYEGDGTPCDDGDLCTADDICTAGSCVGSPIPVCEPVAEAEPSGLYDFGNVINGGSATVTLTLTNIGNDYLEVWSVEIDPLGDINEIYLVDPPMLPVELSPLFVGTDTATLDVYIAFSPTAERLFAATLVITSNAGVIEVVFQGMGVSSEADPEQEIADVLQLIETSVEDGVLSGSGPGNSAAHRLNALKNMIESAGDLFEAGLDVDACEQFNDVFRRTDGLPRPPDFVEGPARGDLAYAVQALIDTFCTP